MFEQVFKNRDGLRFRTHKEQHEMRTLDRESILKAIEDLL